MRTAALLLSLAMSATAVADHDDRVIEGSLEAADAKRLVLEAGVGDVTVTAGSDERVTWRVELEARANRRGFFTRRRSNDDVRVDLEKVTVTTSVGRERIELALDTPGRLDDDDFRQRWTVTVPPRFSVDLDLDVGDITVRDVAGGVEASIDVGDLRIDVPGGAIEGSVDVGDIELRSRDAGSGEISLDADVGDVDLEIAGRRIRADGGYGPGESIRITGDAGARIRLDTDVGDIEAKVGR